MKQHLKQRIKQNNGFTGQDILIAIFIVVLFLSVFTTLMVNLSTTSTEIEDVKKITEKVTRIADKIDALPYDEIQLTGGEEKDITDLLGNTSDINSEKDNLKVTYIASENESDKESSKEIKIIVKKITGKVISANPEDKAEENNVFEMKILKNAVTVNQDSGDGTGDGTGTGTEVKPIESLEYTETIENTTRQDITKNRVKYINGLNRTDGTSGDPSTGAVAIIWSSTSQTVYNVAKNRFSFWVGYKVKKDR